MDPVHWIQRIRPFGIALATALAICGVSFPRFVLHAHAEWAWGEFVIAPCLVVVVAIGVLGAIWPRWWTLPRIIVIAVLGALLLFGSVKRREPRPLTPDRYTRHQEP